MYKERFGLKHYFLFHKIRYKLSRNITRLFKVCDKCNTSVEITGLIEPENLKKLICKTRFTDRECCGCETVVECREKHDCCCTVILDNELEVEEKQRIERRADYIIKTEPEVVKTLASKLALRNDS